MDWSSYAEELRNQTRKIASTRNPFLESNTSQFSDRINSSEYLYDEYQDPAADEADSRRNLSAYGNQLSLTSGNASDINRNLSELKALYGKQSRKINSFESMLRDCGQLLDSNSESQITISSRIDQLEHEIYSNMQSSATLAKERSELIVQYKTMYSRLCSVEGQVQEIDSQFATKVSAFVW